MSDRPDRTAPDAARTHVLAHRGDARHGPENTLDAFLAALAVPGCDGLEFDVRAARDGTPVLAHDDTLARVFDRPESVADLSLTELAAIGVPTLREVLETVPPRAFLDVELKEDVGAVVVPILRSVRGPDLVNAVVSSFDDAALRTVRRLAPGWPTWLNADHLDSDAIARALALGCRGIAAGEASIDAAGMAAAWSADLEVAAWTVRTPETLVRLTTLGVVAACVEAAALDEARATLSSTPGSIPAAAPNAEHVPSSRRATDER